MDLKIILPESPPGWALGSIAVLTIIMQGPNVFNPSGFMKDFQLANEPAAKMIAFLLVLINGYDLVGALQDNWTVYWYSVATRLSALVFFWSLGPPWRNLMTYEIVTTAMFLLSMALA